MVPTTANGQPAFARLPSTAAPHAHACRCSTSTAAGIARIVVFLDPALFPRSGCPVPRRPDPGQYGMTLDGSTAIVTGASRGFGKAIAATLTDAGAKVIGLARTPADGVQAGDAADPALAERLIREHRPRILVLNAGALPVNRPLPEQTWETFAAGTGTATCGPRSSGPGPRCGRRCPPGSRVVLLSSGAAVKGSPASGGYAGAKATVRFIAAYAAAESERAGLGIGFASLLPALTPAGGVGASGAAAYAAREGTDVASFLAAMGPTLTAEQVGAAVLDLVTTDRPPGTWLLSPHGLAAV